MFERDNKLFLYSCTEILSKPDIFLTDESEVGFSDNNFNLSGDTPRDPGYWWCYSPTITSQVPSDDALCSKSEKQARRKIINETIQL